MIRSVVPADALEIRAHLELLTQGKRGVEIRAVGGLLPVRQVGQSARKRSTEVGFFKGTPEGLDAAARAAQRASDEGFGATYVTLNEISKEIFARGEGQMIRGGNATQDKDILRYRNLLIDFDPVRPSGISSTDAELAMAIERMEVVKAELAKLGWPAPLYSATSGNGCHLVYRLNLEAHEKNRRLVKQTLAAIHDFHSDKHIDVDASVFNPARITKVIGTVSRKGDSTKTRPWRPAGFLAADPTSKPVPAKVLTELVRKWEQAHGKRGKPKQLTEGSEVDDLFKALEGAGLSPLPAKERDYGTAIGCKCWQRDEDNEGGTRPAFVVVSGEGQLRAGCRHATCDADVGSLLTATGLQRPPGEAGPGLDPFATSPEDQVIAEVNALGVTIVFTPTGVAYVITAGEGGARRTLRLKPDAARDYIGSRVAFIETERGLVHPPDGLGP